MSGTQLRPVRVLVLGNSHVAALKAAHVENPGRWPEIAFDFAGGHGPAMDRLEVRAGVLAAADAETRNAMTAINGRDHWDLADHDLVVIAGCELGLYRAMNLFRDCCHAGLPSVAGGLEQAQTADRRRPLSRAAFAAALDALLADTMALRLALRIGAARPDLPLVLVPQPHPARAGRAGGRAGRFAAFNRAIRAGDAAVLAAEFAAAVDRVAASLPGGGRALAQPAATTAADIFTRAEFSAGSLPLTRDMRVAHAPRDYLHANAAYGLLVLDHVEALLAGAEA